MDLKLRHVTKITWKEALKTDLWAPMWKFLIQCRAFISSAAFPGYADANCPGTSLWNPLS